MTGRPYRFREPGAKPNWGALFIFTLGCATLVYLYWEFLR